MTENKMAQYCKLPIPVMAYRTDKEFDIETLEGTHHASVGDWIITGVKGEQYPCKPDIFAKTYIKYGQANKMEIIAALFGKKLGEEFKVKCTTGEIIQCRFSKKGLWYQETEKWNHDWFITDILIAQLIRGEAVIVDD